MFYFPPDKIIYCFVEDQPKVEDMRSTLSHFEFYKGLPRSEEIKEWSVKSLQTVIILDDMIHVVAAKIDALHLFQIMVSHSKLTAFLLSQNLYPWEFMLKAFYRVVSVLICL